MKLTPAYVRSELQRIDEQRRLTVERNFGSGHGNLDAWIESSGQLHGLIESVLRFGLESEMI